MCGDDDGDGDGDDGDDGDDGNGDDDDCVMMTMKGTTSKLYLVGSLAIGVSQA